jgi:predicted PolB exonuclease-like 3'-5' exonuclease
LQEYLTCDGDTVYQFYEDGRKKEMRNLDESMDRIIYASQTEQFVGWMHKDDTLYVSDNRQSVWAGCTKVTHFT